MADFSVVFARSARKELEALPAQLIGRVFTAVEALSKNPHPHGCKKLRHEENLWRIRIGDYRVLYEVKSETRLVDIIAIRHRKDAYRFL